MFYFCNIFLGNKNYYKIIERIYFFCAEITKYRLFFGKDGKFLSSRSIRTVEIVYFRNNLKTRFRIEIGGDFLQNQDFVEYLRIVKYYVFSECI